MAPGVIALAGTQWGKEATPGTRVAATQIIRAPMFWPEDAREVLRTPEDVAIAGGTTRTHVPFVEGKLVLPETAITFEQLPIFLSAGIKNVVTGVADGGGSGKIYAYPLHTTSGQSIQTWTAEGFDDVQEYEVGYVFFTEYTFKGSAKGLWTIAGNLLGQEVAVSTKTGALTLVNVEDVLFQKTQLYLDALGGTIGTTEKEGALIGAEIKLVTGWMPYYTGGTSLAFYGIKNIGWSLTGKLTLEHDAALLAEYTNLKNETGRLMRLQTLGSALTTSATHTYKTLRFDLPVKFTKYGPLTSQDGNIVGTLDFFSAYDLTAALGPSITVVNQIASI
jgi:hypothetical protein